MCGHIRHSFVISAQVLWCGVLGKTKELCVCVCVVRTGEQLLLNRVQASVVESSFYTPLDAVQRAELPSCRGRYSSIDSSGAEPVHSDRWSSICSCLSKQNLLYYIGQYCLGTVLPLLRLTLYSPEKLVFLQPPVSEAGRIVGPILSSFS